MTPDDLLQELRDIHLPEAIPASAGNSWSFIPFIVLVGLLLILLLVRYRRSRVWLHQARRALAQIDEQTDKQTDKQFNNSKHADITSAKALLDLASRVAPFRDVTPLPNAAFLPPDQIDAQQVVLLQEHLHKVLSQ